MSKIKGKSPMEQIKIFDDTSYKILEDRAEQYDNYTIPVWKRMSLDALFGGAVYKIERARHTDYMPKKIDDVRDAMNYIRFIGVRLLEMAESLKNGGGDSPGGIKTFDLARLYPEIADGANHRVLLENVEVIRCAKCNEYARREDGEYTGSLVFKCKNCL